MDENTYGETLRELQENVTEIENPPASELEPGQSWRECSRCGHPYVGSGRLHICPACMGKAIREGREGKRKQREGAHTAPIETCLVKKKPPVPARDPINEAVDKIFAETEKKTEVVSMAETQGLTAANHDVSARADKPASKAASKAAQTMRWILEAVETVERIAAEWGVDVDTVLETVTDALGLVQAVEVRKGIRGKGEGAAE